MAEIRPRLEGKVAIVTGGGTREPGPKVGVGKAVSMLFAREGAKIVVADRILDNAEQTAAAVREEGGEAVVVEGDVTKSDDCRRMAETAQERFGRLDILVNNAAIYVPEGNVVDTPEELWDRIMDINLKGMMLCSKYAIPLMVQGGGGSIINLSSTGGLRAGRNARVTYHTSKGAAIALTRTMAAQHGRENVRVNCIAPGGIDTPMLANQSMSPGVRSTPLGTVGTAWDIAWGAVYLASDEARWVTGILLPIEAGSLVTGPGASYED